MKYNFLNFLLVLFIGISVLSCANTDNVDSTTFTIKTIKLNAVSLINGINPEETLDDFSSSKTRAVALGTGAGYSIGFQSSDTAGIFPDHDYQIPFALPIPQGTTATSTAIFANAWATKANALYAVYIPWSFSNRYYNHIPWDYRHVQFQTTNDTRDHLGKYWFLASDTLSSTIDVVTNKAKFSASLVCMGAIMRVQCIVPVAADYRRVMLVAQNPNAFATYGYYDLFDVSAPKEDVLHIYSSDPQISIPYMHQPFHALGYTDHVTLDLGPTPRDPNISSQRVLTVYMAIPEADLRNQLLTLYIWDSNNNLYFGTSQLSGITSGFFPRNVIRNIAFINMQPTTTLNVSLNPWEKDENICPTCTPVAF